MRPHRLTITAFGPYAETQVFDFDELADRNLFLITGDIGSGKTTIFDAICCALYGETSGGERTVEEMRSHHALPETRTEITLEFSMLGDLYRAWFSPRQPIPKKRGAGFTEQSVQSALYKIDSVEQPSEQALLLCESISKTRPELEGLIGFNVDQFRQVVMLAQGKFRELLNANSADREEILKTLVDTEFLSKFERKLKTLEIELKKKVDLLEEHIKGLLQSKNFENMDALMMQQKEFELENVEVDKQLVEAELVRAKAEAELNQANTLKQLFLKQQDYVLEQQTLTERQDFISGIASELKNHSEAEKLWPDYRLYQEANIALIEANDTLKKAREEQASCAATAQNTAEQSAKAESQKPDQERNKNELHSLKQINQSLVTLAADRNNYRQALKRYEQAHQQCLESETDLQDKNKKLEQTTDRLASLNQCDAALVKTQNQLEKKREQLKLLKRIDQQQKAQNSATEKVKQLALQLIEQEQSVKTLQTSLQNLEQERLQDMASHLASQLEDGQPCTVCGSPDHPSPAATPDHIPSDTQIEKATEELQQQEQILSETQDLHAQEKIIHAGIEGVLKELTERLNDDRTTISQCNKEIQTLTKHEKEINLQTQEKRALEKNQNELKAAITTCEEALEKARQQQNDAQIKVNTLDGQIKSQLKAIPEPYQYKANLDDEITALDLVIRQFDKQLAELTQANQTAQQKLSASQATMNAAETQQQKSAADYQNKEKNLNNAILQSPFTNQEKLKLARLPEQEFQIKKEQVEHHKTETVRIKTELEKLAPQLDGKINPDLEPLETAYSKTKTQKDALTKQKIQLEERLQALEKLIEKIASEKERLTRFMQEYEQASHLSQIANGGGYQGSKLSFSRYLLGRLLDEILAAASTRLNVMSDGRYQLLRKLDQSNKKSAFGLDIELMDAYTGQKRSVNTFSGGEGFLASLSLALGLSEVVQNNSGGIQLDTLFIDEGFGSLNDEALEQAINVLTTLSGDGRLIGVISHVNELKERIDAQLVVRKTANGSSAEFVL